MSLLITFLMIVVVMTAILTINSYLILLERKTAAWIQDRVGPNRVGFDLGLPFLKRLTGGFHFWGLGQPIADGLKFLFKEQVVPQHVDKVLYFLAPCVAVITALLAFAVVPFGPTPTPQNPDAFPFVIAPNIDIGIVFVFAVSSLAVYAIILGGWASNNKYSMIGALRSSAQIISYEIPLGLSILVVAMLTGSLNLERIIARQATEGFLGWNIWFQPLAWLLFFTAALAETNRLPFDLPECEQELVGGFHTEYSAIKFVMFFLGEYTHMITVSFLTAILFFGGWHFPFIAEPTSSYPGATAVKILVLVFKAGFFIFLIMVLRWSLPRFRYDQLMRLAWVVLIPLGLLNVIVAMIVLHWGLSRWWLLPISLVLFVGAGLIGTVVSTPDKRMIGHARQA
ncbi:MAG: NADH-quinone oxidoreductase subunit NuoH [Gemmatales bacterium]|nr:NADH-quinone oxidoreductase subunit NuoH [Gemmatales bacterium]MDW8387926.1 NADH-quinone oxidoreductase subunit NuoH [Gemmatales bacterium]